MKILKEVVEEVPVDVTLEGTYAELAQFTYLVSAAERMARTKNVIITESEPGGKKLKFEGQVVGYKLAEEKRNLLMQRGLLLCGSSASGTSSTSGNGVTAVKSVRWLASYILGGFSGVVARFAVSLKFMTPAHSQGAPTNGDLPPEFMKEVESTQAPPAEIPKNSNGAIPPPPPQVPPPPAGSEMPVGDGMTAPAPSQDFYSAGWIYLRSHR